MTRNAGRAAPSFRSLQRRLRRALGLSRGPRARTESSAALRRGAGARDRCSVLVRSVRATPSPRGQMRAPPDEVVVAKEPHPFGIALGQGFHERKKVPCCSSSAHLAEDLAGVWVERGDERSGPPADVLVVLTSIAPRFGKPRWVLATGVPACLSSRRRRGRSIPVPDPHRQGRAARPSRRAAQVHAGRGRLPPSCAAPRSEAPAGHGPRAAPPVRIAPAGSARGRA